MSCKTLNYSWRLAARSWPLSKSRPRPQKRPSSKFAPSSTRRGAQRAEPFPQTLGGSGSTRSQGQRHRGPRAVQSRRCSPCRGHSAPKPLDCPCPPAAYDDPLLPSVSRTMRQKGSVSFGGLHMCRFVREQAHHPLRDPFLPLRSRLSNHPWDHPPQYLHPSPSERTKSPIQPPLRLVTLRRT
jgi:hypothetical protein